MFDAPLPLMAGPRCTRDRCERSPGVPLRTNFAANGGGQSPQGAAPPRTTTAAENAGRAAARPLRQTIAA
ncbi:phosphoribosylaminoimidazolecarboxamide formyltransferase [Burkholderia thailandensis]|nr:phosphoribosylaminoimidazolecarboxamide formyltransferase [Burkholderia thailandensis]AOI50909.1 phosphoribosylaminoimidazolecarboxamide formyltransferase [Burkholderia thailandensis]AOJ49947.1 phosphoribosylaminoimidazolecarboxamide formyltransferase [Burkholderia thailandensis]AOJ57827.1 phosphoribosylaminoimidazolecarboxamide formyltransferase [Burkholderia thailandensis]AVR25343.1 phosphoribosylaminoimidazolecarboxamide formyltransferase [Burkholderia thailandensis]